MKTISKVEQYFNVDTFLANPYRRVDVSGNLQLQSVIKCIFKKS